MSTATRGHVVITGASTGIGEACARRLAGEGFHVWAGVRRAGDAERLAALSPRITPLIVDVTDPAQIAAAAGRVTDAVAGAGIVCLVNNAGISVPGPLEYLPLDDLRHQFDVNVIGAMAVTQAFLPLVRAGRGRIVFIGSIAGRLAVPFLGAYAGSKFALRALCDALRGELAPWQLHVVLIEPGSIATPIWDKGQTFAQELKRRLPTTAIARYQRAIAAVEKAAARIAALGAPTSTVVDAVVHAITASRPRTRYLVGGDARGRAWVARLPDRLRDRLVWTAMRLPRRED